MKLKESVVIGVEVKAAGEDHNLQLSSTSLLPRAPYLPSMHSKNINTTLNAYEKLVSLSALGQIIVITSRSVTMNMLIMVIQFVYMNGPFLWLESQPCGTPPSSQLCVKLQWRNTLTLCVLASHTGWGICFQVNAECQPDFHLDILEGMTSKIEIGYPREGTSYCNRITFELQRIKNHTIIKHAS